jgi:hypothetical protein
VVGANLRILIATAVVLSLMGIAGSQTQSSPGDGSVTADYPKDRTGVLVQAVDWLNVPSSMPRKTRAKHGIAASFSYGAVPATVVSEYEGVHASVQVAPGQPIFCICHILSLPGAPVLVRLHPKKDSRELDGGRMRVLPVVGGSKTVEANQTDLIAVDVSQPENMVWLVRPRDPLPAGEYALMLGTQNVNLFPFSVGEGTTERKP